MWVVHRILHKNPFYKNSQPHVSFFYGNRVKILKIYFWLNSLKVGDNRNILSALSQEGSVLPNLLNSTLEIKITQVQVTHMILIKKGVQKK